MNKTVIKILTLCRVEKTPASKIWRGKLKIST